MALRFFAPYMQKAGQCVRFGYPAKKCTFAKVRSVLMKKWVLCLLLWSAGMVALAQRIPAVKLQDAAGAPVGTSSLIDHKTPFVVSIWMTTCKPCLKELDTLSEEIPDWDASFPLRIYAVSMDDSRSLQRAVALSQGRGWEGITPQIGRASCRERVFYKV